jgi:hypothetical protein
MRINKSFTRRFQNADNNQGNQAPSTSTNNSNSFGTGGNDPFSQSGNNVFNQIDAKKNGPADNMTAPNMGNNNMPAEAEQRPPANATNPNSATPQGGSPLDKFSPQSNNTPNETASPQNAPQATPAPAPASAPNIFDNTLESYQAHMAKQQNVAGTIDPELATKALSGDMDALGQMLNGVAQNAVAMSMHGSGRIAQQGMNANMDNFRTEMPTMITDHQVSNVFQNDATMNHPALKPMVDGAMSMFRNQFPEASPQELQTKVQEYLHATSKVLLEQAGGQVTDPSKSTDADNSQSKNSVSSFFNGT